MSIAYKSYFENKTLKNKSPSAPLYDVDSSLFNPIINFQVTCTNLYKLDNANKINSMVVLFGKENKIMKEIARTEVSLDNPNPTFQTKFQAIFIFEIVQSLQFKIFNVESNDNDLSKHGCYGYANTDVQTLIINQSQQVTLPITNEEPQTNQGQLILTVDQVAIWNENIIATPYFYNLKKMRTFSQNCPFLVFSKRDESGKDVQTFQSTVLFKVQSGTFQQINLPLQNLCNRDKNLMITVSVLDHHENKNPVEIGSTKITFLRMLQVQGERIDLINGQRRKTGQIQFMNVSIEKKIGFFKYFSLGLRFKLITAIDFTASNGNFTDPNSLHFTGSNEKNQYEQTISAFGSILCPYDSDQKFPVFGFGGIVNGKINHCFPLTFSDDPQVSGLDGILNTYRDSIKNIQFSSPTLFNSVIKSAILMAKTNFTTSKAYTVLLIITDGNPDDSDEIMSTMISSYDSPLSIIIVGVGNENFSRLEKLDGGFPFLKTLGKNREHVKFITFPPPSEKGNSEFSEQVLADIPYQACQYMKENQINWSDK